jgi:transcriptional/translational regulatory protein YebC/TACO1
VADLRHLFKKYDGNLGKDGSVGYLFEQKGRFEVDADAVEEMDLFEVVVDAGAEDLRREDDVFVVTTPVEVFADVEGALEEAGIEADESDLVRIPTTTVSLDPSEEETVRKLVDEIEDQNDVETVYTTLQVNGDPLVASG